MNALRHKFEGAGRLCGQCHSTLSALVHSMSVGQPREHATLCRRHQLPTWALDARCERCCNE